MREAGDIGSSPAAQLDWSTELSEADSARLAEVWKAYAPLDDAQFEPQVANPQRLFRSFLSDCRPDYLKRHRLQSNLLLAGTGLSEPLPSTSPIWTVVWGHWYA